MDMLSSLKKDWVLTQEAFDKLLASLNPNREIAASRYESIRKKLISFFTCRHCPYPEDCADMTINRVARKISAGEAVFKSDASKYFFGVAYKLLKEQWKDPSRNFTPLDETPSVNTLSVSPPDLQGQEWEQLQLERQIECLEKCLERLPADSRELITHYYEGEKGAKIENRKRLAERLGIQPNALRIRAQRIRDKLEDCVNLCLNGSAG
jgi:RNA polymerase sigma factor (sigma-70 family)